MIRATQSHQDQLDAHVVNYVDDFVICRRPGNAEAAMTRMTALMTRLGLEVNGTKTQEPTEEERDKTSRTRCLTASLPYFFHRRRSFTRSTSSTRCPAV